MTMINVKKTLESNLPSIDDDFTMSFTDEGNLYFTKNDGSQLKVSDLISGYIDVDDLESKNPSMKDKLYMTNELKMYIYVNGEYKEVSPTQDRDILFDFESLSDLQTKNPALKDTLYLTRDGKMYLYDGTVYVEISGGGSGSGAIEGIQQITRLDVTAPHTTEIPIEFTSKFGGLPLEVLKVDAGSEGIIETLADFDNSEISDFEDNEYVEFDGTAHLKTDYEFLVKFVSNGIYEWDFAELDQFKKTVDMSVGIDTEGHATLDNDGLVADTNLTVKSTKGKTEGKWYWEVKKLDGADYQFFGIANDGLVETMHSENVSGLYTTTEEDSARYLHRGDEETAVDMSGGLDTGDVLGIALDMDENTVEYYKNGEIIAEQPTGAKPSDLGAEIYPSITSWQKTNLKNSEINLGSKVFDFEVPEGFLPYNFVYEEGFMND